MNYIKAGFGLAVGWQLGEVIFEAVGVAIRYYVPEKYWNRKHPDYPGRRKTPPKNDEENGAKMKIGFSID